MSYKLVSDAKQSYGEEDKQPIFLMKTLDTPIIHMSPFLKKSILIMHDISVHQSQPRYH